MNTINSNDLNGQSKNEVLAQNLAMQNLSTIITLSKLCKKVARLSGNRDLNPKIIKEKKVSLKENGQLIPAVIVNAIDALNVGLDVVDFETGKPVTEGNASEYVVLIDANHRYKAHLELKEEDKNYKGEFYFIYPLNSQVSITKMLPEINIATNPWKGAAYGKGAKMMCKESLPLLDAINELTDKGYSLDAACKWLTFKSEINKTVLADAMNGKINEKLKRTNGIDRGKRLLSAATGTLDESILKTRTIADWIISKYEKVDDIDKVNIINDIESFFKSLSRTDVTTIEKAKGKRGESTKEQIIYKRLNELFDNYIINKIAA